MDGPSEIIDLSHDLYDGMPNFDGYPVSFGTIVSFGFTAQITQGRLEMEDRQILMPEHCGTHLDAPRHFDPSGLTTAELPLSRCVLPGHLLDFSDKGPGDALSIADFEAAEEASGQRISPGSAVVAWTGADRDWGTEGFQMNRAYVPTDAAQWLLDRKIDLFATDLVGIDDPSEWWWPTHKLWLGSGLAMVQQLRNLDQLVGKDFLFVALPLKMREGTGSPLRAIALVF